MSPSITRSPKSGSGDSAPPPPYHHIAGARRVAGRRRSAAEKARPKEEEPTAPRERKKEKPHYLCAHGHCRSPEVTRNKKSGKSRKDEKYENMRKSNEII